MSNPSLPSYYKPEDVGKRYTPRLAEVYEAARAANLKLVRVQDKKRLFVGIDYQNDFAIPQILGANDEVVQPAGSLLVNGAVDDIRRVIEMLYAHADYFTGLLFTMDMHIPWQIFFGNWWNDRAGNPVKPFTLITLDEVKAGDYRPAIEKKWSYGYIEQVKAMMIWPYHCMTGTEGSSLVPALAEAVHYISIARGIQPNYLFKGTVPQTEHYGPFCPVVEYPDHDQGTLNTGLLDRVADNDELIFAGEAEDFCVKQGMIQVMEYFGQKHQAALKKIRFLSDATSMVFPDKRAEADSFLQSMIDKGIQVTTTAKLTA